MDRRWQPLFLWSLVLGVHPPARAATPGYLPAVGPPPLRFAQPRASVQAPEPGPGPASLQAALARPTNSPPAIAPAVAQPGPSLSDGGNATNATTPPVATPVPSPASPEPAVAPVEPPPAAAPLPPANQTIMPQPQLFLQYFTPDYLAGTNSYGVTLPVSFVPPQPRGNSSATYQTTPAEKVTLPEKK